MRVHTLCLTHCLTLAMTRSTARRFFRLTAVPVLGVTNTGFRRLSHPVTSPNTAPTRVYTVASVTPRDNVWPRLANEGLGGPVDVRSGTHSIPYQPPRSSDDQVKLGAWVNLFGTSCPCFTTSRPNRGCANVLPLMKFEAWRSRRSHFDTRIQGSEVEWCPPPLKEKNT